MKKTFIFIFTLLGILTLASCTKDVTKHQVRFLVDNEVYRTESVEDGKLVSKPAVDPNKSGYEFVEWRLNDDKYLFDKPVLEDLDIHAAFKKVLDIIDDDDFSYYAETKLASDKKIYVLNSDNLNARNYTNDEAFTAQAIQGLFSRDATQFYFDGRYITNGVNIDAFYINQAAEEHDLELNYITLEEAVELYKKAWQEHVTSGLWGSQINLTDFNNIPGITAYTETDGSGFDTPGFIVYRKGTTSVNVAATLSGLTGFLPVELEEVERYIAMGLTEKFNVDNIALSYQWLFNIALSEINPDGLVHQNYAAEGGYTNRFIKDYGIANKYMHVYYDSTVYAPNKFRENLHNFLTPNRPIFGYTYSEDSDVAFFSKFGQFIVPTDYSCNLTFFSAKEFKPALKFKQPNDDTNIAVDSNKHYVAFVVSDGDNATYWQNTATFSTNYMSAVGRDEDDFAVTWSISPSLADLMPQVLNNTYNNIATPNDYFMAPVSGQGYINAGNFQHVNNGEFFDEFVARLDTYMKKSSMSAVTVIGGNSHQKLPEVLAGYASAKSVTGGLVYDGYKYFGNVRGGVMWVNGKPFIGPRDSLWETTPEYIAARLNMYEKDPTSINGYSVINVHPWSHNYDDIRTIVNLLDDSVEVVSMDAIVKLMSDNITDKSNTEEFKIPEKNGVSITEGYLQERPELIPVNPLFNDFLLWQEDWTGAGVTYSNNDQAMSNVGAIYKGSIIINSGTTAEKQEFSLPNIDTTWISFSARADSTDPNMESSFKMTMTVDGVTKTIIESATLRGVKGTGTKTVTGDGWQKFAFPLAQYFENFSGKKASVSIEVLSGVNMKLDQFEVAHKELENTRPYDAYSNEFEDGNTEDWMLGHIYKTSQYWFFGAHDRDTLQPHGSLQIDASDGGGDEKRNGNTNMWTAKHYTLPASNSITISYKIGGGADDGAMAKLSMYIDGKYIVLAPWERHVGSREYNINLQETYSGIDFNGKVVTIVLEVRDSGVNNGVGEYVDIAYFRTIDNE